MSFEAVPWWEALPDRLVFELAAMAEVAPDLEWSPREGLWRGRLPVWPFTRARPENLESFTAGRRLLVEVQPVQAHPAVAPKFWPLDPEPELAERTQQRWHVNGDGSLCLFQRSVDWAGDEPCAALIPKASGWFLEYLLMKAGSIEAMTINGIVADDGLDGLMAPDPA